MTMLARETVVVSIAGRRGIASANAASLRDRCRAETSLESTCVDLRHAGDSASVD